MKYFELINELKNWKETSGEENPEVVIYDENFETPHEINFIIPKEGIENNKAIGIIFEL